MLRTFAVKYPVQSFTLERGLTKLYFSGVPYGEVEATNELTPLYHELEKVKQRRGEVYKRESDAYFKIWNAVSTLYRLLSELQRGTFDPQSKAKIDAVFEEAEPYVFIAEVADQELFYSYWQASIELMSKAATTSDGSLKENLWKFNLTPLANKRSKIQQEFKRRYLAA